MLNRTNAIGGGEGATAATQQSPEALMMPYFAVCLY